MITLEQLKPFCSTNETRSYLMRPFTDGDFTYATDGHVIVRVPGMIPGAHMSSASGRQLTFSQQALEIIQPCVDTPVSAFVPFRRPSGNPVPQLVPCDSCEGQGCEECDMAGKHDTAQRIFDALFGSVFNVQFLNLIWDLGQAVSGGIVCAPSPEGEKDAPHAHKLFARGVTEPVFIVLMPLRWTPAECPNLKSQHYQP